MRTLALSVVAAVLVFGASACRSGHSESWHYGYDHAGDAARIHSTGFSLESSCRSIGKLGHWADSSLDAAEAYDGCMGALSGEG